MKKRRLFACIGLAVLAAGAASAQAGYRYTIVAGPAQSIDGFSPTSLNETGEVVYADNANGVIATSTGTVARVGDMIDGELLGAIPAGSGTSINDDGSVAFRARYGAGDFDAIFTADSVIAKAWDNLTGQTLGYVGHPAINASGDVVYEATICPNMTCTNSALFRNRIEILRAPVSDGFVEVTGVGHPVNSDAGVTALYGYAYLADTSAVYLLPVNGPLSRIVQTGDSLGPGLVLDNPRGLLRGVDLNERGDVVTTWRTEANDWVVLKNDQLVAQAGSMIAGVPLTQVFSHRPAINDAGVVAFIAEDDGGSGVFTQSDVVLHEGQPVGSETIRFLLAVAINDSGVIAAHVSFESDFFGIVLATPVATNRYVEMRTGSSVALRQTLDLPSAPFAMRVDHRFTTSTGLLNVRLGGVVLGSVAAPGTVGEALERVTFDVSGQLLGQSDATLELELEGPTGSTLEIDNVFLPGLVNGTFQSGDLAGWQAVAPGAGSVDVVPEPSPGLLALACLAALACLRGASGRRAMP